MTTRLIIDTHYLAWRAFFTTGGLSFEGIPTGVTFGFLKQLETLHHEFKPCEFIFAWDSRHNLRKEQLQEYKSRNDEISEEEKENRQLVAEQVRDLRRWALPAIGINQSYMACGFEADDVIAKYVMGTGEDCIIVSGDDDLLQLLDYCSIYNPAKEQTMNKMKFKKKYEIDPGLWGEVKAMAGCDSDNVPGVSGVGEKTAVKYLLGQVQPHTQTYKKIAENAERIAFLRQIVVLPHKQCPNLAPRDANEFNREGFREVCDAYGLSAIKKQEDIWREIV